MSELTDKKLSEEPVATSMLSTDIVSGIVNSKSVQIPPEVLKEIINSFEQVFAQNVEVLGAHKAVSYDGDGALLVNLTSPGPGGSEATANLTLRCNSGGLNPSSQILGQKHNDFIFYADENGFGLKSGIPYTHEDDAIPFDKDLNLLGKELLQSKTILDQQVNPYFNFNGVSGNILVADDPSFAELFANGGTYICKFNAFSTGETSAGMFFEKILQLFFTGGEWRVYVPFSGTIGDWLSTGVNIPLNLDTTVVLIYNGSNVSNNPTLYVDGVEVTLTETSTPVGTITTDVGTDLYIGSRPAGSRTFDGNKYKEIFLNRELTAAEAKSFSSNPQKALYFADIGGSNINVVTGTDSTFAGAGNWVDGNLGTFDVNSTVPGKAYMLGDGGNDYMYLTGVFTLGKAYRITLKAELLVGASTELLVGNSIVTVGNDTFGITPTGSELTYTGIIVPSTTTLVIGRNASIGGFNGVSFSIDDVEVTQLGATLVLEGKNATSNVWHDSANGLKGIVSGATLQNEQVVHRGEPYNWIINGDHRVNQRGLSGAITAVQATYQATDMWDTLITGVTGTVELVTTNQPSWLSGSKSLKYIATSTASGKIGAVERIEDYQVFNDKIITMFAFVKSNNSDSRLLVQVLGGDLFTSSPHSGGGEWELLFVTLDIGSTLTGIICWVEIIGSSAGNVSITSGDYIEFTGVGFVFGSQIAPFTPRDLETEEDKADRLFYRAGNGTDDPDERIASGRVDTATDAYFEFRYPERMRIAPTLAISAAAHFSIREKANNDIACTAVTIEDATQRGCTIKAVVAAGLTVGESVSLKCDNASATLDFDAQL